MDWHDQFKTTVLAKRGGTEATRGDREENLCSLLSLLLSSPGKPELRECIPTRLDVGGDIDVIQFGDEITVEVPRDKGLGLIGLVNCAR